MLLGNKKYDAIYNKIKYLTSIKSGVKYIISHYSATIKVDSYYSMPMEQTLHNVIIHIKSVLNKDINYNIFLEKCSYQLAKK